MIANSNGEKQVVVMTNMPLKSKRELLLSRFTPSINLLFCCPNFLSLDSVVFPYFLYVSLIIKMEVVLLKFVAQGGVGRVGCMHFDPYTAPLIPNRSMNCLFLKSQKGLKKKICLHIDYWVRGIKFAIIKSHQTSPIQKLII